MKLMNYATSMVAAVAPRDSLDRAMELMEKQSIHHLVVVEGDRVIGMLSDRDMLIRACEIVKIEVVVRNIIAGSLAKRLGRPEGLRLGAELLR